MQIFDKFKKSAQDKAIRKIRRELDSLGIEVNATDDELISMILAMSELIGQFGIPASDVIKALTISMELIQELMQEPTTTLPQNTIPNTSTQVTVPVPKKPFIFFWTPKKGMLN